MKLPKLKFQRGEIILAVTIAVGLTALIGGLFIKSVQDSQKAIDPLFEPDGVLKVTDAQLDAAQRARAAQFKAAELTGVAINLGTGGGAEDLTTIVGGKVIDKVIQRGMNAPSCPAPQSLNPDNRSRKAQSHSILLPDDGNALKAIASGALNVALATQLACGTTSNTLPSDVTAAPIAGCTSGTFVCGNGNLICRDKVCNQGTNDCGDNTDESSSLCGAPQSCCQVTNGCPGETGSTCGSTCCCCPQGQACDRVNPGRGCVASN